MWVTGIMEGLMWREVDANGFLVNSFADTVAAKFPMYVVRGLGGVLYLTGALIMCYNLWMTVKREVGRRRPSRGHARPNKEGRTMAPLKNKILEKNVTLLLIFAFWW
jgi:cytochrome c oxidase cbb3-type subunit 1